MADTHILEGNFEIRPGACRRPAVACAFAAAPSFAERWSSLLADSFFALLERLKLCQAPHILHAECLADDNSITQAVSQGRRQGGDRP